MWQSKLIGVLGIWVIALAFLGFSVSLQRILLTLTGIFIALVALRSDSVVKPTKELLEEQPKEIEKETSI